MGCTDTAALVVLEHLDSENAAHFHSLTVNVIATGMEDSGTEIASVLHLVDVLTSQSLVSENALRCSLWKHGS